MAVCLAAGPVAAGLALAVGHDARRAETITAGVTTVMGPLTPLRTGGPSIVTRASAAPVSGLVAIHAKHVPEEILVRGLC